jgi:hypothetical protein
LIHYFQRNLVNSANDYPLIVFALSFLGLLFSAWIGRSLSKRLPMEAETHEDFKVIQAATLTLFGLIIGFSFSMASGRYDQRKHCEAVEANAIGAEYVRAELLPAADAAQVRELLLNYLDQRVLFYETRDEQQLLRINAQTAKLQVELWSAVRTPSVAQPQPIAALAVAGMNDVLNSQGYTQAAWWNRIPRAAWAMMAVIAIFSNIMVGFGARRHKTGSILLSVLPFIAAITFLLIADIDCPGGGLIRVIPQNLLSLSQFLHVQ